MKVILQEDIGGLGKKYDVKDVPDGYARNFLLPKKLVKPGTPDALKDMEKMKTFAEKEDAERTKRLMGLARQMEGKWIEFEMKTDDKGSVFGSVTKEMILKAMREHQLITKERVDISLEHPLKKLGEHRVPVDLKKGITAELKVILKPAP